MVKQVTRTLILLLLIAGCATPGAPPTPEQPAGNADVPTPPATQVEPVLTPTFTWQPLPTAGPEEGGALTPIPLPTAASDPDPKGEPQPMPEDTTLQAIINLARADLAKQLGVDENQIEFVQMEAVTWPDGSLGCPQPGVAYIQIMVEGYRIQLAYAGEVYHYHGGGDNPPFLCEGKPSK